MNVNALKQGIKDLAPAYFALPMSTGIITIASHILGYTTISEILYYINNAELIVLSLLLIARLILFFPDFVSDLGSHAEGAGFLTIVAAMCIFGTKSIMMKHNLTAAVAGWTFAFVVWVALIYSFFLFITFKKDKPTLETGINGSWLLFVVSAQALSISGNTVAAYFNFPTQMVLFVTVTFYLLGVLFYIIIIGLIFYRTTFFPMLPEEFRPSYWINMGAAAISTLAGATLIKSMAGVEEFQDLIPIIKLFTMLFWISGTWWIPVIGFMELWKRKAIKINYSAGYWSLVFPLGVYTVCTWLMAEVLHFDFLKVIPEYSIYVAWLAWLITYFKMGHTIFTSLHPSHTVERATHRT